jgi:hypothetical protein
MNFERSDILRPILDDLEANDQILFNGLQQRVLAEQSARGMLISTVTVSLVFQTLRDKLSERAERIISEIRRVLAGAYIEDSDNLFEALKVEWNNRMESAKNIAASEFQSATASIRMQFSHPNMPSENAIADHVTKLRSRWFGEIELFCRQLHDSQAPRLFLKAGEVFACNRAARAIFAGARQSLDIIDTYFGPEVFDMLEVSQQVVKIRLISDKAKNPTKQAYSLFNQQFNNRADFRLCDPKDIHDRFIIVDGRKALHVGHSIMDLGGSDTLIDSAELDPHKKRFEELWLKANPVV